MKMTQRTTITVNKTEDERYPYIITISTDYGISTSIWLNEETMGTLDFYIHHIRLSDILVNQAIMSTVEYEKKD